MTLKKMQAADELVPLSDLINVLMNLLISLLMKHISWTGQGTGS